MDPALPAEPTPGASDSVNEPFIDVGDFEQGTPVSRWALARYLVGRAVAESVSRSLLLVAVVVLGLAAVAQWVLHSTVLAVLLVIVALGWLAIRAVLRAVLNRLIAADRVGPLESRLRALVSDTRGDVLRELRRVGLPGRTWTLPVLAFRLLGKRRQATFERLRQFDLERAVPQARLDELHLLLRGVAWRSSGGSR
ncbi:MAG TPA: hypothetical protein VJ831_12785 [Jatrophihabitantaceae bacterium]|nr:hypothetical protein [Jatrophihabitantaceae bacterium]